MISSLQGRRPQVPQQQVPPPMNQQPNRPMVGVMPQQIRPQYDSASQHPVFFTSRMVKLPNGVTGAGASPVAMGYQFEEARRDGARPKTTSWHPVNRTQRPPGNMLTPEPNPQKRRLSLSEIDESFSIDTAIDIFQKSQSSIMVSLPSTGSFDNLIQRVEETMALMDKTGISLAHKAKRRRDIAKRLSERKCGTERDDKLSISETGNTNSTRTMSYSDLATTKSSTGCIQKQSTLPPPNLKDPAPTTKDFSPILQEMISEVEAGSQNKHSTTPEYEAAKKIDDQPETLVVEKEYSPLKVRIVRTPKRKGGYIIANCKNGDWMLELGVRLEREERERKERDGGDEYDSRVKEKGAGIDGEGM
ncbi:hypothetical protein V494_06641 [Pseudogymnoascus sp. VKM F-4513 (FW-928)]|nr:hypothetical protein V494_06641 [Pseudogymnoascus sp. VKM F-4513 (FW-928)]